VDRQNHKQPRSTSHGRGYLVIMPRSFHQEFSFMSHRNTCLRLLCLALAILLAAASTTFGQEKKESEQGEIPLTPIFVTTRIFQLSAKKGSYQSVSDQVFRLKSAGLTDEDKWLSAFKKVYPEFTPALLQTDARRIFRTSRPATLIFGHEGGRILQAQILGSQSIGDGVTPGTTLLTEVILSFGNDRINRPISFAIQPLEVESGMTYFYAATGMKLNSKDYATFIRNGAPAAAFSEVDMVFVFAFSVDLTQPEQSARLWNEQQSAALLKEAQKKVQPELPTALKQAGLGGKVQVRVEITPDGKVSRALTHSSTFPEMNREAVAAARKWEFSPTLFADDKTPISGLLTFEFAASQAKPAEQKQSQ
jgi:TonB family protein